MNDIEKIKNELEVTNILKPRKELLKENINVQLIDNYLILGNLVAQVFVRHILFMYITQESKETSQILRSKSFNQIVYDIVYSYFGTLNFFARSDIGIMCKTQICYRIIGYLYEYKGYDYMFNLFKNECFEELKTIAKYPIDDYERLVKSFLWKNYYKSVNYNVKLVYSFDEYDQMFSASLKHNGVVFTELGVSRKEAVRNVAKCFVEKFIPEEELLNYCNTITSHKFEFKEDCVNLQYDVANETLHKLLEMDNPLLWFCLLSRSKLGRMRDVVPFDVNASRMKRNLINFGRYITTMFLFEYNYTCGNFKNINLIAYDMSYPNNMGPNEVYDKIQELLKVDEFSRKIYSYLSLQRNELEQSYHNNDISQISFSIVAGFFVSNFDSSKKFMNIFQEIIKTFYSEKYVNTISDYRLSVQNFANQLGLKIAYDKQILDNGDYELTVYFDKYLTRFSCCVVEKSAQKAKEVIWQKVFYDYIIPVEKFLSGKTEQCNDELLQFVIEQIVKVSENLLLQLKQQYNLFNVRYAQEVGDENYYSHLYLLFSRINNNALRKKLASRIAEINSKQYFIINENAYTTGNIITIIEKCSTFEKDHLKDRIASLIKTIDVMKLKINIDFDKIINPTFYFIKQFIEIDYRNVQRISHLTDEAAKYALDLNIDAYSYINNPSKVVKDYFNQKVILAENLFADKMGRLSITNDCNSKVYILNSHADVSDQLMKMCKGITLRKVVIACGYAFNSGFSMLKEILEKPIIESEIEVKLLIGSLQKYRSCAEAQDGQLTGIDKKTIQLLQSYLNQENFSLFTCEKRFYHGKIYFFEGIERTIICTGSSNISRSAFVSNYELNIVLDVPNNSDIYLNFCKWIDQLFFYSVQLNNLDLSVFSDNEINVEGATVIRKLSISSIQHRIDELSNEEVKYRLNLWMEKNPDLVADDLCILSLPEYIAFVYYDRKLLVLESFQAGNSYFCIKYENSFEEEINRISTLSKTEIFQYSRMPKRGYHTTNKFTLESNISEFFKTIKL
ncbi:phospholipase D-like domain-containing protein [Clostridium cibarium]|uniref:Phospholipase D-like domain-containing protein n=1 Tax=Clostridium cibarium TaxID=2762247 RepID=A0ABR8PPD5_9CLOT|nr:phospholipase D-like domain-containing protein [Clostridium cibarium]MBD7910034.1 hypothetical protein [Clostridium cibarium]